MSEERKTIYLCLAHMSEEGWEQKYVKEAFAVRSGLVSKERLFSENESVYLCVPFVSIIET